MSGWFATAARAGISWRLGVCAAISTLLLVVDLRASQELPLLPLFWLPALIAASFASPRQVSWLSVLAMAYGLVHLAWGRAGHHDFYGYHGVAITAGVIMSVLAVWLSQERTSLQDQLKNERKHYRLLAENSNDIIIQTDSGFRAIWISATLRSSLGIQPEQLLGQQLGEFLLPEDRSEWLDQQQQATKSGAKNFRFQGRFLTGSGTGRWLELMAVACPAESGDIQSWIMNCRDIEAEMEERRQRQQAESRFRLAMEASAAGVVLESRQGHFLEVNQALCRLLGRSQQDLLQMSWQEVCHPDDLAAFQIQRQEVLDGKHQSLRMRSRYIHADGSIIWGDLSTACIHNQPGACDTIVSQIIDVSASVSRELEVNEKNQLLQTILDNTSSLIYMKDSEHRYVYANRHAQELIGRRLGDIIGRSDRDFFSGEVLDALWEMDDAVLHGDSQQQSKEEIVPNASGELRQFLTNKIRLQLNGESCLIGLSTDITDLRRAEQKLATSERKFRLMFDSSLDAIMLFDPDGTCIDANPATLELFGVPNKAEFLSLVPEQYSMEYQHGGRPTISLIESKIKRTLKRGTQQFEWVHRRLDNGKPFLGHVTLKAIMLNGRPALLTVVRDISERKRYEESLRKLAYCDRLTDLPNRIASLEHLEELLGNSSTLQSDGLVVVNLDIDGFQAINDSFGLGMGDRVLRAAAEVMRAWLQPEDWLARLDSDEFLIIRRQQNTSAAAALRFGHDLQHALSIGLSRQPDLPINPQASIGLALYPEHSQAPIVLLQAANTALMEAKRTRKKSAMHLYSADLSLAIQQRLELDALLERAIDREQLHLLFQPQVNAEGKLVGAEALLRWTLADGRCIGPDVFIPLAEQSGQMEAIGNWVVESALAQLAHWQRQGLRLPRLAINLSAVQFENRRTDLATWLMQTATRHGVSPTRVELEITETALLRHPQDAIDPLLKLSSAGFRIAIDDFGTGYSSLVNLHRLPVHKLKIDKTFVHRITDSDTAREIIDSTIVIAQKLGLETMAEGVETEGQWQALKDLGCDSFQGNFFDKPLQAEALAERLRQP